MQLIILGMHRSGTSAISGLFQQMGANFGSENLAFPVHSSNQKGFFERTDVVRINDRLLESAGASWIVPERFPRSLDVDYQNHDLYPEALAVVQELNSHPDWFLKDPRMCVTLPFWMSLFTDPVFLLVLRNPLDVARSLNKRGDCPMSNGLALWERYTRDMFWYTRGQRRVAVWFEDVIAKPYEVVTQLFQNISRAGEHQLKTLDRDTINLWFNHDLVHHEAGERELAHYATSEIMDLFRDLRRDALSSALVEKPPGKFCRELFLGLEQDYEQRRIQQEKVKAWKIRHRQVSTGAHELVSRHRLELEAMLQSWRWKGPNRLLEKIGKPPRREEHHFDESSLRSVNDELIDILSHESATATTPTLHQPMPRYPQENPGARCVSERKRILLASPDTTYALTIAWLVAATRWLTSYGHSVNWLLTTDLPEVIADLDWPVFAYVLPDLLADSPDPQAVKELTHVIMHHDVVVWGPALPDANVKPNRLHTIASQLDKTVTSSFINYADNEREGAAVDFRAAEFYPLPANPAFDVGLHLSGTASDPSLVKQLQQALAEWNPRAKVLVLFLRNQPDPAATELIRSFGWTSLSSPRTYAEIIRLPGNCRCHITFDAESAGWSKAAGRATLELQVNHELPAHVVSSFLRDSDRQQILQMPRHMQDYRRAFARWDQLMRNISVLPRSPLP